MNNLNKIFALLLCIITVVSFAACSKGADEKATTAEKKEEQTTANPEAERRVELTGCVIDIPDGWKINPNIKATDNSVSLLKDGGSGAHIDIFCNTGTEPAAKWGETYKNKNFKGAKLKEVKTGDTTWFVVIPPAKNDRFVAFADRVAVKRANVEVSGLFISLKDATELLEAVKIK